MSNWDGTPKDAIRVQNELSSLVRLRPLTHQPRSIGGADVSMARFALEGSAGFVTLSLPDLSLLSKNAVSAPIAFPYIPGLLSFREIPMLLEAWKGLAIKPDVVVVDGVGIAHPRRMGIATHLGLLLNIPTIGCAKGVLIGRYREPNNEAGSEASLMHPKTGEIIGTVLRTKQNVKPVFISPGHLITLEESVAIVKQCVLKHRLPEPTRRAHIVVNMHRIGNKA